MTGNVKVANFGEEERRKTREVGIIRGGRSQGRAEKARTGAGAASRCFNLASRYYPPYSSRHDLRWYHARLTRLHLVARKGTYST